MTAKGRLRSIARTRALDALGTWDRVSGRAEVALRRPRVHFVYLHGVPPQELERFGALVDQLAESHEFVSHSQAVDLVMSGAETGHPIVSISFDDGFLSNVEAARSLQQRGISGCFFLPSDFIGTTDLDEARRFFRTSEGVETAMSWDDVEWLLSTGHEVGNHTRHHPDLSTTPVEQLTDEIGRSREVLRNHTGTEVPHFAWPLGRLQHMTPLAARTVFETGHKSCASAIRGAHVNPSRTTRPCLRRDHIMTSWPSSHVRHFLANSAQRASAADNEWPESWDVLS